MKLLLGCLLFLGSSSWAAKPFPASPEHYIYDETGSISAGAQQTLFEELSLEDQKFGNQILVAVFKSLDDEDLVDYTNRLFTTWKPGQKNKNNGILIAAYLKEHKIRVEVGYGLEAYLTDAKSKDVVAYVIGPEFKKGDFSQGVLNGVHEIQKIIHADGSEFNSEREGGQQKIPPKVLIKLILFGIIFLFVIMSRFGFLPFILGGGGRGGWGGGGGGFGGGGGGDFGGGGGMSGGGGASGDW